MKPRGVPLETEAALTALATANQSLNEVERLQRQRGILARAYRILKNQFRGSLLLNHVHEITILNLQCRIKASERHERHLQELVDHLRNELSQERKISRALLDDVTRALDEARSEACLLSQLRQEMSV